MTARSKRRFSRRAVAAAAALTPPAILLLSSCEFSEPIVFKCGAIGEITQKVDSKTPGWVDAGGAARLELKASKFEGNVPPAPVTKIVLTMPIPSSIAEIKQVTFTGGDLKGTHAVKGGNLVLTLTATTPKEGPELPTIAIEGVVKPDAKDQVQWQIYGKVATATDVSGLALTQDCRAKDPTYVVDFSRIREGGGPTVPTSGTTATTAAPTSTTAGPTTTVAPTSTTAAPATTAKPTTTTAAPTTTAAAAPKTYAGDALDEGMPGAPPFGRVQVSITVSGGKVTEVKETFTPANAADTMTASINQNALPTLRKQVLDAQGTNIAGATGATFTTAAYKQSAQSALVKAGLAK